MENLVRKVREALGWNQADFARAIGRSYASVQGYESGKRIPPEVGDRVRRLAAKHGIKISSQEGIDSSAGVPDTVIPSTKGATGTNPSGSGHSKWHSMLDEILDSGVQDAATAVQQNLVAFSNYARSQRRNSPRKKAL
jgi:hypothetical protein